MLRRDIYKLPAEKAHLYIIGDYLVMVSNSQFNLMKSMSETSKRKEWPHPMVHEHNIIKLLSVLV